MTPLSFFVAGVSCARIVSALFFAALHSGVVYNQRMVKNLDDIPLNQNDEQRSKEELNDSLNKRISYLCRLVALIIAVVTFATTIIGEDNTRFVILGLSLALALLAIAGLQSHVKPKR